MRAPSPLRQEIRVRLNGSLAAAFAITLLSACNPDGPIAPSKEKKLGGIPLTQAAALLRDAVAGIPVRNGEQDEMLKLEARLPGFGGFFIDEGQRIVVFMKDGTAPSVDAVEGQLAQQFGMRREARIREVLSHLSETRVITGKYSLSELVAIENTIATNYKEIPGFSGGGVSLFRNKVKIGFTDASSLQRGCLRLAPSASHLMQSRRKYGGLLGA